MPSAVFSCTFDVIASADAVVVALAAVAARLHSGSSSIMLDTGSCHPTALAGTAEIVVFERCPLKVFAL